MSLFTAEGMLRGWVRFCVSGIGPAFAAVTAGAYCRWLKTQGYRKRLDIPRQAGWLITHKELFSRRAPGTTCISALRSLKEGDVRAENDSKGCGGVMRVAPVGIFMSRAAERCGQSIESTFQLGADIAAITHGHPTGYLTAGTLALIIAIMLRGATVPEALSCAKRELLRHDGHLETMQAITLAEKLSRSEPNSAAAIQKLGQGWVAEEALAISLYCALCARDFEQGVVLAVNHDGDSDSTGAIAGNLLGCCNGISQIPKRWLEPLELREVIEELADNLVAAPDWDIGEYSSSLEGNFYYHRYPPN